MTRKQTATTTDEVQETAEPVQELSRLETLTAQCRNACAEIARLEREKKSKEPFIQDRAVQIALAQQKHREAKEAYDQAVQSEQQSLSRIERQEAMAKIGGEAEHVILQSLLKEHERFESDVAQARQNLEEAEKLLETIPAITESLEQIRDQLVDLDRERDQMMSIRDEIFASLGKERAESIAAEIISTRDVFEAHVRRTSELEAEHDTAVRKINSLREDYPDLYRQLLASHGHALQDPAKKTAGEYIVEAFRAYILALLVHGPRAHKTIYDDVGYGRASKELAEYLAISGADAKELMSGASWMKRTYDQWGREVIGGTPGHPALDRIDEVLREVRKYRDRY